MGTDTQRLPCQLTPAETAVRADELARTLETLEVLKADKAAAVSRFREMIKLSERKSYDLGDVVRTGKEYREVPVRYASDFEANQIHTIRLDTGEVVSSRPMEAAERQQAMDFADGSDDEDDATTAAH